MLYIEFDIDMPGHWKTDLAAHELDLPPLFVSGIMPSFWAWALKYADDGNISRVPRAAIAKQLGWPGEAEVLFDAMVEAGFLERDGVTIHDWEDYAGRLLRRRRANAERMRNSRGVAGEANPAPPADDAYSETFEQFWKSYPRKIAKRGAWRCWRTRVKQGTAEADMIAASGYYGKACASTEPRFIMHPSTFLGPDQPFLDFVDGVPEGFSSEQRPEGLSPGTSDQQCPDCHANLTFSPDGGQHCPVCSEP
jgi:hypothetical protein